MPPRSRFSRHLTPLLLLYLLGPDSAQQQSYSYRRRHGYRGRENDYYGEFYVSSYGIKVYTYCYDPRYLTSDDCRPLTDSRRYYDDNYYYPVNDYHRYDGRGNINVGRGRFYKRGPDMVVECEFPRRDRIVSNVVWFRKTFLANNRREIKKRRSPSSVVARRRQAIDYNHRRNRFRVRELGGPNGSRLTILNYRPREDDGVYRCFAVRSPAEGYGRRETVFMEIDVLTKGWKWN